MVVTKSIGLALVVTVDEGVALGIRVAYRLARGDLGLHRLEVGLAVAVKLA
jgi:hypothetical protein